MKAIGVFPGTKQVRLVDHPAPRLESPTGVLLRILEVGICGTDREICAFEYGTPPAGSDYIVLGHECLAEVIETGPGVTRVKPGDIVVPSVRRPCPRPDCPACRAGRQDFCFTGEFTERGINQAHGYITEVVVEEERYLTLLPKDLRDVGVLVEPLTIAEKGLIQVRKIQERLPWGGPRKAVVLGAGPVGLLGAMKLICEGFETFVYSRSKTPNPKSLLVESLGATYVSSESETVEDFARRVGNIDVVYEGVGVSRAAFDLLRVLGTNAVYVMTGVPPRKPPSEVDTDLFMRNLVLKNQVLLGTVNAGPDAFAAAVADLARFRERWPGPLRALLTGRYPIEAYSDLLLGKAEGIKNIFAIA